MTGVQTVIPTAALLDELTEQGGFTLDPVTGELLHTGDRDGWVISRAGTERQVDPATFAERLPEVMAEWSDAIADGALVGGWYSRERGVYVLDLSDVFDVDRVTALVIGAQRDQEAVFSLATGESVSVPTWDAP
jgi:hypothetical protein